MTSIQQKTRGAEAGARVRARGRAFSFAALVALTGAVVACNSNDLLEVDTPATVPVSMIDDPKNADLAVNSAIADFQCAFGSMVAVEGIISDELADAQLGRTIDDEARLHEGVVAGAIFSIDPPREVEQKLVK